MSQDVEHATSIDIPTGFSRDRITKATVPNQLVRLEGGKEATADGDSDTPGCKRLMSVGIIHPTA